MTISSLISNGSTGNIPDGPPLVIDSSYFDLNRNERGYMNSAKITDISRGEIETLLPDDTDEIGTFAANALTPDVHSASQVTEDQLRDIAVEYLNTVLLAGTDDDIDRFVRNCVTTDLSEETLTVLLIELQALLLDAAEHHGQLSPRQIQHVTGRDLTAISAAFARLTWSSEDSGEVATDAIEEIHSQVDTITERSAEIESLTEQQASNMDHLSREVGDVSAAVEEIATSTGEVNDQSDEAAELAKEGCTRAGDLSERIDAVHTRATRVNEAVEVLTGYIEEIDEFVETIDKIADQTNMLALNASIEAARVDGGEGFAVVADEVKSLAENSQEEAARIRSLVETIGDAAERVSSDIEEVYEETEAGREEIGQAVETFDAIEKINMQLSASMDDVASATDQQAESTEELAMMSDEANRKASMILEEINQISESNQQLLESVETSLATKS